MSLRHAIWKVGSNPKALPPSTLASEQLLENMIVASPEIISDELMLIGRQENTSHGGRIDLVAIAPDGTLVLIEIKRGRTPRDVVAQAIDYASWVEGLQPEDLVEVYGRYAPGRNLKADFRERFGQPLDEESLNENHQIIIVAGSLDYSSERIVAYLNARDIPINVLCFQVFTSGAEQLLSRAWLLDPVQTQSSAAGRSDEPKEPWNGEFYVSFGEGESRSWEDAMKYGFVSAGGGAWYSKTLNLLKRGDRIWVRVPGSGFVGVGRISGKPEPATSFRVSTDLGDCPILEVARGGHYHRDQADDEEKCEYFVPVKWLEAVPLGFPVRNEGSALPIAG